MIDSLEDKIILSGYSITKEEALQLVQIQPSAFSLQHFFNLFSAANRIRETFRENSVDLCSIVNAKSGACPEDCSYCAQSSKSKTEVLVYPLVKKDIVIDKAKEAKDAGVKRFCVVTSGRKIGKNELIEIASMITDIRSIGLLPCATLGLMDKEELSFLKESGLERYHHNLETSERFFPEICRTHTYHDKLKTIDAAKAVGLSICSGGIFGLGETWQDRIDMAFAIKELNVDSVPINFLIPVKGTSMGDRDFLHPFEALKIISLYRFMLPEKEIRVCGGRMQILGEFNSMVFMAGADALLTGNYLTTTGRTFKDDLRLIEQYGLRVL
ncbi:MAG: biotin synthase BioB [Nitrospiraceae bacterium]|nr:biotin synthase BioB [Nitrospiraceae bacterium]